MIKHTFSHDLVYILFWWNHYNINYFWKKKSQDKNGSSENDDQKEVWGTAPRVQIPAPGQCGPCKAAGDSGTLWSLPPSWGTQTVFLVQALTWSSPAAVSIWKVNQQWDILALLRFSAFEVIFKIQSILRSTKQVILYSFTFV